jgi:hypothetical protein
VADATGFPLPALVLQSINGGSMKFIEARSIETWLALGLVLAVAACGDTPGQRAVTGGALGAGTGAVVGSTVGHPLGGAVVGGLGGAAVGAATAPDRRYY